MKNLNENSSSLLPQPHTYIYKRQKKHKKSRDTPRTLFLKYSLWQEVILPRVLTTKTTFKEELGMNSCSCAASPSLSPPPSSCFSFDGKLKRRKKPASYIFAACRRGGQKEHHPSVCSTVGTFQTFQTFRHTLLKQPHSNGTAESLKTPHCGQAGRRCQRGGGLLHTTQYFLETS